MNEKGDSDPDLLFDGQSCVVLKERHKRSGQGTEKQETAESVDQNVDHRRE